MKMIIGLGNPGSKYRLTRHNIGFMLVEELARRHGVSKEQSKYDALIGHTVIGQEKVLLVKPLTYMNLSGQAVRPLVKWFRLELEDLIVVYDDMDLSFGVLRIRPQGGTGGHKGIASISNMLGTRDFARMRLGVGRLEGIDAARWVLSTFGDEEKPALDQLIREAADACETWIKSGLTTAMNQYNKS